MMNSAVKTFLPRGLNSMFQDMISAEPLTRGALAISSDLPLASLLCTNVLLVGLHSLTDPPTVPIF